MNFTSTVPKCIFVTEPKSHSLYISVEKATLLVDIWQKKRFIFQTNSSILRSMVTQWSTIQIHIYCENSVVNTPMHLHKVKTIFWSKPRQWYLKEKKHDCHQKLLQRQYSPCNSVWGALIKCHNKCCKLEDCDFLNSFENITWQQDTLKILW